MLGFGIWYESGNFRFRGNQPVSYLASEIPLLPSFFFFFFWCICILFIYFGYYIHHYSSIDFIGFNLPHYQSADPTGYQSQSQYQSQSVDLMGLMARPQIVRSGLRLWTSIKFQSVEPKPNLSNRNGRA